MEEGEGTALYGAPLYGAPWRSPTPTGSSIPPSLVGLGEKEGGEREEGKGGPVGVKTGGSRVRGPELCV